MACSSSVGLSGHDRLGFGGRHNAQVADHAGGGEPVLGGQHGVEASRYGSPPRSGVAVEAKKTVMALRSGSTERSESVFVLLGMAVRLRPESVFDLARCTQREAKWRRMAIRQSSTRCC